MTTNIAIILAGGSGSRFSAILPKQFWFIDGNIVLQQIIKRFIESQCCKKIICVLPERFIGIGTRIITCTNGCDNIEIIKGGETRRESVYKALSYLHEISDSNTLPGYNVIIHDSARYLCSVQLIRTVASELEKTSCDGIVPCTSVVDSIIFNENYINRDQIKLIQTPQGFKVNALIDAHNKCTDDSCTDDGSILQRCGYKIKFITGEITNIKLT